MYEFDNAPLYSNDMNDYLNCLGDYEVVTDTNNKGRLVSSRHAWVRRLIKADHRLRALGKETRYLESKHLIQSESVGSDLVRLASHPLLATLEGLLGDLLTIFKHNAIGQHYAPSPYVDRFLRSFQDCVYLNDAIVNGAPVMTLEQAEWAVQDMNRRLEAWYRQLSLPDFDYECQRLHRNSRDNLKRLRNLIQALFDCHGRLLVLRVDLAYGMTDGPWIDYETAKYHRERLCQQFHTHELFAHQLGYAWKLEWGPDKGFHYHFVFFFDANRRREPISLNEKIGELWAQSITGNQGVYYNCNRNAESTYVQNAMGEITYHDLAKRGCLDTAIRYLIKVDDCAALRVPGRSFQTSAIPRPRQGGRLGRPRRY